MTQERIDINEIMSIIPHRYPFLLVDRIIEIDLNIDQDYWTINWEPAGVVNCDTCAFVNLYSDRSTDVAIKLLSDDGCLYNISFFVNVNEISDTVIPNIFSPNGDGFNDYFTVGLEDLASYSIMVFDRWGNRVYTSVNASISWDGTFNGKDVEQGVYTFIISFRGRDGDPHFLTGDVTVIR